MQIDETTVLGTGCGRGLGGATTRHFATQGARAAFLDFNLDAAQTVTGEIGGFAVRADVGDDAVAGMAFDAPLKHVGSAPRLAISRAGIGGRDGKLSFGVFKKTPRMNPFGTCNEMRNATNRMAKLEPLKDGERGVFITPDPVAWQDGQLGQAPSALPRSAT